MFPILDNAIISYMSKNTYNKLQQRFLFEGLFEGANPGRDGTLEEIILDTGRKIAMYK